MPYFPLIIRVNFTSKPVIYIIYIEPYSKMNYKYFK